MAAASPGDPSSGLATRKCESCGETYTPKDQSGIHYACSFSVANFSSDDGKPKPASLADAEVTIKATTVGTIPAGQTDLNRPPSSGGSGSTNRPPSTQSPGGSGRKRAEVDLPPEVKEAAQNPKNVFNQYVLTKQIGKGGMGTVWKAFDKQLLRWAAIKFLIVEDEEAVERFEREAQLAARLRHPNIAPIFEVKRDDVDHPYIAMEFIEGTSLDKVQIPLREMVELFAKVCDGIEAAHKAGVVHRDLKPQNIMVTKDKWPYVMDFGLAKNLGGGSSLSVSGQIMGTPAYMPPEQASGKINEIDARTDTYSLGATLYAILTRKQPFTGETAMDILRKVCDEDVIAPRKHVPEIPDEIETILLNALSKDKAERYQSSADMAADLRKYLTGGEIVVRGPSSMKLLVRKVKRHLWPIVAASTILVAGVVVLAIATRPGPSIVTNVPVPKGVNAAEDDWIKIWYGDGKSIKGLKEKLAFSESWVRPRDGELADTRSHLGTAYKALSPVTLDNILNQLKGRVAEVAAKIDPVYQDKAHWTAKRDIAVKAVGWCDCFKQTIGSINAFEDVKCDDVREKAVKISGFTAGFTLKIAVAPFAKVTSLKRGGKAVDLPATSDTPLVLAGLEMGAYEIELSHPELGKKTVTIAADQVKENRTYLVSGSMKDKLKVRELAP